jgi:hypothetical protein
VRIEGSSEWSTSDSLGAFRLGPFKSSKGEPLPVIVSAASFQNHRYQIEPGREERRLYAFSARYLSELAESHDVGIDAASGLVIGRVAGLGLRIDALADDDGPNLAQDFYFDEHGAMRPSPAMTVPRFGNYLIFNLPAGHVYLLGRDRSGKLRYGREIFTNPSVVNVEVDSSP